MVSVLPVNRLAYRDRKEARAVHSKTIYCLVVHSAFRLWKQDGIDTLDAHDSELLKMHVTTEQGDRAKFSYRRHVVLRVQ